MSMHLSGAAPVERSCGASDRVAIVVTADAGEDDRTAADLEPVRLVAPCSTCPLRILLVEPNDHRRFARAHALRAQHRVATAPAMAGALQLLASEAFDVILIVEEPGGDTYALLDAVAIMWPDTHRCLAATTATPQLGEALAMRHVSRVYAKPFDIDTFFDDLRRRSASSIHACRSNQQGHLR